ncbi:MAG: hypothetical protein HY652_15315 [Acidobacteria bacterium]|nr:hypothetical protein [Acidobacteriota bacterium]
MNYKETLGQILDEIRRDPKFLSQLVRLFRDRVDAIPPDRCIYCGQALAETRAQQYFKEMHAKVATVTVLAYERLMAESERLFQEKQRLEADDQRLKEYLSEHTLKVLLQEEMEKVIKMFGQAPLKKQT